MMVELRLHCRLLRLGTQMIDWLIRIETTVLVMIRISCTLQKPPTTEAQIQGVLFSHVKEAQRQAV